MSWYSRISPVSSYPSAAARVGLTLPPAVPSIAPPRHAAPVVTCRTHPQPAERMMRTTIAQPQSNRAEGIRTMERAADVVIIGAGVMGTSTAFQLVQRGVKRVVVLEKSTVAAGSSGKSSALVRMHY